VHHYAPLAQLAEAVSSNLTYVSVRIRGGVPKMQNLQKCYTKGEKVMMQMNRKNIKSRKTKRFGSFSHGLIH